MRIERGFPGRDRNKASLMFWDAFEGKLNRCMGPKAKGLRFVQEQMQPHFSFSAYEDDTLLGLVGFKTAEGGFIGGGYRDLAQIYGYVSSIWRGAALSLFERELEDGQMLLDGIFVTQAARGKGVGTALLSSIEEFARFELCREIRLDVIDTNPRAKALYERNGYVASGTVKTGILSPILGFGAATTMIKTL